MSTTLTLKKSQPFRKRSFSNFSIKKSPSTSKTTSIAACKPASYMPASTCLLNEALSRANLAVLYDSTGNTQEAISSYKEAMRLLDCLMSETANKGQRDQLEKIVCNFFYLSNSAESTFSIGSVTALTCLLNLI